MLHVEYMDLMEGVLEGVLSYGGIGSALSLASYVFCALSLYTIAQRRGIKKPWLAWIPVVNVWTLGSISDQYRYVVKGELKSKRKVLLAVNILHMVLSVAAFVQVIAGVVAFAGAMMQGYGDGGLVGFSMNILAKSLRFAIPALFVSIVGLVFELMALYDVYTSCEPANNVLYLILSIIPGVNQITKPLFLFLSRNQDGGMPPRREPAVD